MDTCTYYWGIPLLWVLLPGTLCIQCLGIYTYSAKFWQSKFLWIAVFEDIDEKICVLCIRNYFREFGNNPCACRTCNLLWASLASLVLSNALSHLHLLKLTAVSKALPMYLVREHPWWIWQHSSGTLYIDALAVRVGKLMFSSQKFCWNDFVNGWKFAKLKTHEI